MRAAACLSWCGILVLCGLAAADPAAAAPKSERRVRIAKAKVVKPAAPARSPKAKANPTKTKTTAKTAQGPLPPYNGWNYLAEKLKTDGVAEETIRAIFESPRMPLSERIHFSLAPRDTAALYRGFTQPARLAQARACLTRYHDAFSKAENYFGVDARVLAAILLVETHCGKVTGSSTIINRLVRVASVASPDNLQYNLSAHRAQQSEAIAAQVRNRADYLENTFYPEIPALIEIAQMNGVDIFEIRGSYAGAFGIPQFLPSAYLKFGVDGDGDGRASLFNPADAIASTANFLSSYGWRNDAPPDAKRRVIWRYNHCPAYVDTILKVAELLRAAPENPPARPKAAPARALAARPAKKAAKPPARPRAIPKKTKRAPPPKKAARRK